jgi:hypothetical protein
MYAHWSWIGYASCRMVPEIGIEPTTYALRKQRAYHQINGFQGVMAGAFVIWALYELPQAHIPGYITAAQPNKSDRANGTGPQLECHAGAHGPLRNPLTDSDREMEFPKSSCGNLS